ncbi:hypothetical protein B0T24DRAFT_321365 [Lasiosphaeria ovina]|uniref:Uncharacterized protein n=1 Tax=Lasiosphaeria ovina TaxID=92902 RepID=A0AAE0K7H0_9PEZI|nr:hypothetical protein B0T24DRAFT_321365 [Lasiosphaeria ovina]
MGFCSGASTAAGCHSQSLFACRGTGRRKAYCRSHSRWDGGENTARDACTGTQYLQRLFVRILSRRSRYITQGPSYSRLAVDSKRMCAPVVQASPLPSLFRTKLPGVVDKVLTIPIVEGMQVWGRASAFRPRLDSQETEDSLERNELTTSSPVLVRTYCTSRFWVVLSATHHRLDATITASRSSVSQGGALCHCACTVT